MVSFKVLKLCTELGCKVEKVKPPRINFGVVSNPIEHTTPCFNIGTPTRVEQAVHEMTGATQLAAQNRAFIIGSKPTITFGTPKVNKNFVAEPVPYTKAGADVKLTYCEGTESLEFNPDILRNIKGYTDSNGNVLPYLFLDDLTILNKGNGLGRAVMEDIKQIAKDRCGGRLLLIPSCSSRNPSPFYYKCGLRSTTKEGTDEILAYLNNGTPFKSGSSTPMYLPIE